MKNIEGMILATAVLAAVLAMPAASFAEAKSLEAIAAESASTADEHLALAAYYEEKASKASDEAKLHREMAVSYSSKGAGSAAGMKAHCDNLVKAADASAAEYKALAKFHEDAAKGAK